jgi:hypothetical protein
MEKKGPLGPFFVCFAKKRRVLFAIAPHMYFLDGKTGKSLKIP